MLRSNDFSGPVGNPLTHVVWRPAFSCASVVEETFTTEDTEVHRDAQGKMKRTFYEW